MDSSLIKRKNRLNLPLRSLFQLSLLFSIISIASSTSVYTPPIPASILYLFRVFKQAQPAMRFSRLVKAIQVEQDEGSTFLANKDLLPVPPEHRLWKAWNYWTFW